MVSLITGGSGFLGQYLAEQLSIHGEKVIVSDIKQPYIKNKQYVHLDVLDKNQLKTAMKNVDYVFNVAALLPCSRAGNMFWKVNVDGTRNVLEAALENKVKKVIHISSSIVYGIPAEIPCKEYSPANPIGDYGKSKLAAEKVCEEYIKKGLTMTILRPRLLLGPGRLGLLYILFDWIKRNKNVYTIGKGNNRFQMISIKDFVAACILCINRGDNEIINLGADAVPTVKDLFSELIIHAHSKSKIVPLNATISRSILKFLDTFKLTPLNTEHYMIADKDYMLDTSKAKKLLNWEPKQTQSEAMKAAYDWFIEHADKLENLSEADNPKLGVLHILKSLS